MFDASLLLRNRLLGQKQKENLKIVTFSGQISTWKKRLKQSHMIGFFFSLVIISFFQVHFLTKKKKKLTLYQNVKQVKGWIRTRKSKKVSWIKHGHIRYLSWF
jgi:hypothetical protein